MRWTKINLNVSNFRSPSHLVSERGSYSLYRNGGKGWIMWRQGVDWYIYGPYNYKHVVSKYNSL